MADFETHSLDNATGEARDILETVNKKYGFVPNLTGNMVEAPTLASAYLDIGETFGKTSFDATEQQVVLLAVSRYNECEYCMSAHTAIAGMNDVPQDVVDAIRNDEPIGDQKLEALRTFTRKVVEKRGWVDDAELEAFFEAGYGRQQVLEVLVGIAMKTLSNYTNHIAGTKLDDAFEKTAWSAPDSKVA